MYRLTYQVEVHKEGLSREEVMERRKKVGGNMGACDALVLLSIIFPPDGSYSILPITHDGRIDDELSAAEVWKAWTMLALHLSERADLTPAKRELCKHVFDAVAAAIRAAAEAEEREPD